MAKSKSNLIKVAQLPLGSGTCVVCGCHFKDLESKDVWVIGKNFRPQAPCCINHRLSTHSDMVQWVLDFQVLGDTDKGIHLNWILWLKKHAKWMAVGYDWIYKSDENDNEILKRTNLPTHNESIESVRRKTDDNLRGIFE